MTAGQAVAVDSVGDAYITGFTLEPDFPVTFGSFLTTFNGANEAFVVKLNGSGQIVYATYIGGSTDNWGIAIAVDGSGNAFVAGDTHSADFPTTDGAYSKNLKGAQNVFLVELNSSGTTLVYSTYLGSSSNDYVYGLALDPSGDCYVVGQTNGSDFPTTTNALETSRPATGFYNTSGFVSKLNATGMALVYSTFIGGSGNYSGDSAVAVAVDSDLSAYVVGTTTSVNFPTTSGALKTMISSSNDSDVFLVRLSSDGGSLQYSTLLGGTNGDRGAGVALDGNGGVYVAGSTSSRNYPTTAGAFQVTDPKAPGSNLSTSVISKIDMSSPVTCTPTLSPTSASIPWQGGPFSFNLTLAPGCPWEAVSNDSAITLTSAAYGMGSTSPIAITGTIPFNDSTASALTTTVQIGTAAFTINQAEGSCQNPLISPLSHLFDSSGGIASINLSVPFGCSWTASSAASWLTITAPSPAYGIEAASITVSAAPNDFSQRSTTLTIDGVPINITQTGSTCTATATATPLNFNGAGGTGVARITTSASNCVWGAYSLVPWIQITPSTASGQGAGSAPFVVAGNPGLSPRTGQILIADQIITINQTEGPGGTVASYSPSIFAGDGMILVPNFGDGGPATSAFIQPQGIAFDPTTGNVYITDEWNSRVRVVTPDGNINTFAGGGTSAAENVPPLTESLADPSALAVDAAGSVFVNDNGTRIMQIANGNIATFAGGLGMGSNGDGGPATSALLGIPRGIVADTRGNVYISDSGSFRVRKVNGGIITAFAGGGTGGLGDQGPATSATLSFPLGLAVDSAGNVYIAEFGANLIREVITQAGPKQGTIITVAGGGTGGDGGPATSASLNGPSAVAFDPAGNMFIAENQLIRKVALDGTISTVAGTVYQPYDYYPAGITADLAGNVYFSDANYQYVYKLTPLSAFCTYTISPVTTQPNTAGPLSINVTAATGCNWTASSDAPWATISSGAIGSANGTVQLTLTSNTTNQPRTGNINIAGQVVSITQNGNPPALTAAMMHTGSFRQGQQNAVYFVAVSNAATSMSTSAPVTVTDFAPSELTLVSMSGTGWTCGGNICSRSDALAGGSSYPPITVTVKVASNAPSQVTNEISVVGGGSTGATASDPTTIASISIALNVAGCFTATVQGEPTHATSWTISPQIGTLEIVPMWIGITPFAGPFDQIDIACYTPSPSGPNTITLTATSEADTGLTTSILLNGHTGQPD